jgi:hypothetical protein
MKNLIKQLLRENLQLADKVYFNSGKLSPRVREIITRITNGDPYTKIMTDIYYTMLTNNHRTGEWAMKHLDPEHQETEKPENDVMSTPDLQKLRPIYNQLKEYDKNVFPIKGFNINGVQDTNDLIRALIQREKIINIFGKWPSIAKRNMQKDIRTERNGDEMYNYRDILELADSYVEMLNNRNENAKKAILMKMFPNNATLEDVIDFAQEKENLLGGVDLTRKQIDEILKKDSEQYDELDVKYNKGNIMIIEVSGPNGIKEIGCNSVWCFSYNRNSDNNLKDWANNSTNGYCYVIIDFNKPSNSDTFMHVLTKPLRYDYLDYGETGSERLYTMSNRDVHDDEYDGEYSITVNEYIEKLIDLPTAMKIMNFGLSTPKDQNEKQFNSNQIELNEIKKILREGLITEALYNIDDDVDLIYDNFFAEDLDTLLKTRKLNNSMFYNTIISTSILSNPLCVKANEINPCKILINFDNNIYNPNTKTISITASKRALEFIKDNNNDFDKALDNLEWDDVKKIKSDLSEEKIKGSIHHELTHWLDDTFNNNRIKRAVDKFIKKNKKVGRNNIPIDADTLEIQAQIHNIHQLKRKYQDVWDNLTFNEMMNMSVTIRVVYNNLPLKYRNRWVRDLKTRMYREGLLGKNMY